ncbi:MAG: hypothetical protein CM1200mP31_2860 [Candidatus Neomarinimicrobiota bacterium]|nr:MAG: hypothetical protein CM1200mP31_2860 [Candidatus Neomarinimicrobiota bacterium]
MKIRGGSDRLPYAFSDYLNQHIALGMPVQSVEQQSTGVTVRTTNGTEFTGDRALCTVPLTVLNKIQFTPSLSSEKQTAMNGGYRYAPSTRVYIQFQNRFWENEGLKEGETLIFQKKYGNLLGILMALVVSLCPIYATAEQKKWMC